MPDLNPDPKLMRDQQDKDTPERIAPDETHAAAGRSDSDAASQRDRESAKAGVAPNGKEQMASIFEQNGGKDGDAVVEPDPAGGQDNAGGGLARNGRSLLGE